MTVSATADGTPIGQSAAVTVTGAPPRSIGQTLLTSGNNTANQKVYTTAPISPAANALVTVAVLTHQSSSAAPAPVLSGGGMTAWSTVATLTFDGTTPLKRMTIYRAMSPAPGNGPITITSSVTVSDCQWIVSQWDGVDMSGANGAGAIGQAGSATGTGVNGLAVTLAPFSNVANVAYGVFGVNSSVLAITPGIGFTKIDEQPSMESTPADLFAEWATYVAAVGATWTGKNGGALAVEIKVNPAP